MAARMPPGMQRDENAMVGMSTHMCNVYASRLPDDTLCQLVASAETALMNTPNPEGTWRFQTVCPYNGQRQCWYFIRYHLAPVYELDCNVQY
jgi:hypothetical protein